MSPGDMDNANEFAIAIIGMAGRFPGARNVDEFWQNLCAGRESITFFSDEALEEGGIDRAILRDPSYVKAAAVLEDADLFDASFFGYSPKEAKFMDPQQRLFLECAWEALEHAGYDSDRSKGPIGVFGGSAMNTYLLFSGLVSRYMTDDFLPILIGSDKDFLSTRVSYKLNLRGPSLTVQTACSTSLVAVHLACQSLLSGECDMVLAGGVSVRVPLKAGHLHREGSIFSPDGHCRAFDAGALGTIFGSGVGIVVLRRLSDAMADGDSIHAVIRGTAINNDGSSKVDYTAPSVDSQSEVILQALANAGLDADTISYVETHGTGTVLGDPIEIAALTNAYRRHTERKGFCAIGSVKTGIGHLDAAAGIAGLIKTSLALKHKMLPPSLNFEKPNPAIDFANSPFYVNSALTAWKSDHSPRRAGISSLGVGGTNAHVILEEAPPVEAAERADAWQLLVLSAKTGTALDAATANLVACLKLQPHLDLADVAYTLQNGRKVFNHRRVAVCRNPSEAVDHLSTLDPKWVTSACREAVRRNVVFMFSGQGSQYINMGLELYRTDAEFRAQVDRCSEILQPHLGFDLRDVLYPAVGANPDEAAERLTQTSVTQPALFVIEYALARCWMTWGVAPAALVGHSIGEYVAACLAGVFSLEEALALVAARGRLMHDLPPGSMLAVSLPEHEVLPFLGDGLTLAVINGPALSVVSGETADIEDLERKLAAQDIRSRRLHTSHAFHSRMMDPILVAFEKLVAQVRLNPPQIPFVSNVTGTWITPTEATDPSYWARHLRQTVRFDDCLKTLLTEPNRVLLEVGPAQTLCGLAQKHPQKTKDHIALASLRHPEEQISDVAFILRSLGQLWLAGVQPDWSKVHRDARHRRVALPAYPFERSRYWLDGGKMLHATSTDVAAPEEPAPPAGAGSAPSTRATDAEHAGGAADDVERSLLAIWRDVLGGDDMGVHDDYFRLGGSSLIAVELFARINKVFGKKLPMAVLYDAPTVRQLAGRLRKEPRIEVWRSLVAIRPIGTKAPFFCVHSEGGNVLEYRGLASSLGDDYPFYALQAQGLNGEMVGKLSFEEIAAHYLAEIRQVQPHGPYYLGGYCLGADIAYEMAQQLRDRNERVALVAMIQSRRPDYFRYRDGTTAVHRVVYRLRTRMDYELSRMAGKSVKEKITYVWGRVQRAMTLLQYMGEAKLDPILSKHKAHSQIYHLEALAAAHIWGYATYRPRPYDDRVVIFRSAKQPFGVHPDPTMGWGPFIKGNVQIFEIPGYHQTILDEPNVQILAQHLRSCAE